jgi:type III pantothenate kinase
MNQRIVAVDIGNTHTRVGVVDAGRGTCRSQRAFASAALGRELARALAWAGREAGNMNVSVSSVVPGVRAQVRAIAGEVPGLRLVWLSYTEGFPLRVCYDYPRRVGADRLADALYCQRMLPGRSVVVIDAGTAIKVDLVVAGREWRGGVIMPGVNAQLSALHTTTAVLPLLAHRTHVVRLPGGSTRQCMEGGVLYGIAGGIERIVEEYRAMGKIDTILATGGGWRQVAPFVGLRCTYVEDLTLIGIGLYGALRLATRPGRAA